MGGWAYSADRDSRPFRIIYTLKHLCHLVEVRHHDLRHTFASYAINSRFFLPIIAKILGHADIKTAEIRPFV